MKFSKKQIDRYVPSTIKIREQLDLSQQIYLKEAILKSVLTRLYSKLIGRRLGTESDGTSLRANALDFQKETVTLFTDKINDINKRLIAKYQTQTIEMISGIKQLLSSLGKQAVLSASVGEKWGHRYGSGLMLATRLYGSHSVGDRVAG